MQSRDVGVREEAVPLAVSNAADGVVDGELGTSYQILPGTRVQVGVEVARYFFSMNSEPGDARVAGGAVDQYLSIAAGLSYAWGRAP